ncbi:DUF4920 domain-containing protein [Pedobacter sp. JCM 36344]|uniref:DUF4920 domain-containing protein n=1 Tax=Pedobacter sp. JCM 36344 TaxID=3374280 RepID=UPI00397DA55C
MKLKAIIFSLAFFLITFGSFAQKTKSVNPTTFGEGVKPGKKLPVEEMEAAMGNKKTADLQITGEVVEVCKKKGCWMSLKMPQGETIRITFKDYGFFMPMDIVGKKVALDGIAKKQIISAETLRHYAEDAHQSTEEIARITNPKKELTFEAKGVVILN